MKLFGTPGSPFVRKVRMVMLEKNIPHELVTTSTTDPKSGLWDVNPLGKVPALADGDVTMAEAPAICAYVAERYPQARLAPPVGDPLKPLQLQVTTLDYSDFLGRIMIGRVHNGTIKSGQPAALIRDDGSIKRGRISKLLGFQGLQRKVLTFMLFVLTRNTNGECQSLVLCARKP